MSAKTSLKTVLVSFRTNYYIKTNILKENPSSRKPETRNEQHKKRDEKPKIEKEKTPRKNDPDTELRLNPNFDPLAIEGNYFII